MRTFDFTPLYRSAIGFERLAELAETAASNRQPSNNFPPYNIEQLDENNYRITMAVAGFAQTEIDISTQNNELLVKGTKVTATKEEDQRNFLHRGIAERNFERKFELADHVFVNGADMNNGLLYIELERQLPEAMKPRKVEINGAKTLAGK
ncbi:MAG: molecular chaperone IbpA [Moritella sp.]|jgi:molecular chaperone IbpA